MADYDGNSLPFVPQLSVSDIVAEVARVERECGFYLFPRIRCHAKSRVERKRITEARVQLYERSQGLCELRLSAECWGQITWYTMHACHIRSRARGGPWDLENLQAGCPVCHSAQHNGGPKICPAK
jgi:5-methylcytosine-specific restriction endonuclease McrA